MAVELMIPNAAIKNNIREDKINQIHNVMSSGQESHGMVILNQSLAALVANDTITYEAAALRSNNPVELRDKIGHLKDTRHIHITAASQNNGRRQNSLA